ncbi:MAG TPA: hypothetical protein ENI23_15020, partial [bacterium]|nr:hypothetical protein [bacterium]
MVEEATSPQIQERRFSTEETGYSAPPLLNLDVSDDKLITFIDAYTKKAKNFYEGVKDIKRKREINERFFFGRQIEDDSYFGITGTTKLKNYDQPYADNVIKEGEDKLRPLVLSRLPDLIVNPGVQSQIPRETADLLSDAINKTLQSDELKKILTKAFRHHPIYFTAVIKWMWDPHKGKMGDMKFEVIHPKNVLMDPTATENDESEMRIIIHYVEKSLSDWIMLFPKKEQELKDYGEDKGWKSDKDEDGMAFDLKIAEVWFDWKEKAEDFDPEDPKFDFKSGVLWKIGKESKGVILDKRLNPNWDWEGEEEVFVNGQPVPEEVLPQLAMLGLDVPGIERRKVFRNYFGRPRKPFIFMGYEQYGEMPLDETSRIWENVLLQENYDKRGMQIHKMIDDARGKHVFSQLSGLKKETVEEMDLNDPDEDIFVTGKLSEVHAYIKKEQPSAQMYNDLTRTRERMLSKISISGPTRGEIQTDVATTTQIARESDFTVADDLSDLTINEVSTKMAEALLHMMKLRYTPEHFMLLIGTEGEETQKRLTADIIEDGMIVTVNASGTDKLKAERQAKEEAQLGVIDPINYYKDTGRPDPEIRAE